MSSIKSLFKGRIGRGLFFFSFVFLSVIRSILETARQEVKEGRQVVPMLLVLLLIVVLLILYLSFFAKRFHDIGKSGYWSALGIIPYIQWIVFVYLIFKNGENKKNKYGKVPSKFTF